jgi:hypothetical protein
LILFGFVRVLQPAIIIIKTTRLHHQKTHMSAQFNTNLQLPKEHCVDIAKREMSSYVNLCVIMNGYSAMQSIKGKHPWITSFAFNSDADEELLCTVDLF